MASMTQTAPATKSRLREWIYLDLAIAGTAVPIWLFARYLGQEKVTLAGFVSDAFANGAASLVTADVLMSSLVFWLLAAQEMDRMGTGKGKLPLFMVLNIFIGLSSGLPAFMWWRERRLNREV